MFIIWYDKVNYINITNNNQQVKIKNSMHLNISLFLWFFHTIFVQKS